MNQATVTDPPESDATPESDGGGSLLWTIGLLVAAVLFLIVGLQWVGDIRFTGPKRETAATLVVIGGALGIAAAAAIGRWSRPVGIGALIAVGIGVPAALFVVVDRAEGVLTAAERRPTATADQLPQGPGLAERAGSDATTVDVEVALEAWVNGLEIPTDAVFLDDGTLLVAERSGRVVAVTPDGARVDEPVVDVSADTSLDGEQGLTGIALSPSGRLYLHRTDPAGDNQILSFALDGLVADPESRLEVLTVGQTLNNHNGGGIAFGPDGTLYVSVGDGGGVGDPKDNAQASWNRLGTILRVIPDEVSGDYLIPPDNPWVDHDEIWPETIAYGLRNPLRIRVDAVTGDLWIGEVGDANFEEINVIPAGDMGQNFGWNRLEADQVFQGSGRVPTEFDETDVPEPNTLPAFSYAHDKSEIEDVFTGTHPWRNSVTGGVRYRGAEIEGLYGVYLYGDFAANTFGGVAFDDQLQAVDDTVFDLEIAVPISIIEDPAGEIHVVSLGGTVSRLVAAR